MITHAYLWHHRKYPIYHAGLEVDQIIPLVARDDFARKAIGQTTFAVSGSHGCGIYGAMMANNICHFAKVLMGHYGYGAPLSQPCARTSYWGHQRERGGRRG